MVIDPELKQFATSGDGSARRTVILEVESPKVAAPSRRLGEVRDRQANEVTVGAGEAYERVVASLAALGLEHVRLEQFGYVAVKVTADQLRTIMESPHVAAIRPNRTHRKPREA